MKRILIKLSGEALGSRNENIKWDNYILESVSQNIAELVKSNISVAIVIGGGNIHRGNKKNRYLSSASSDYIGMMATIMNGIMLKHVFEEINISCEHFSSLNIDKIARIYSYNEVLKELDNSKLVILSGGTGNPFCTTDSSAVQKAIETNCIELFKSTSSDGVYSDDPRKTPSAKRFDHIRYSEIIDNRLKIMDIESILLAEKHKLPIKVFNLKENMLSIFHNKGKFTLIS